MGLIDGSAVGAREGRPVGEDDDGSTDGKDVGAGSPTSSVVTAWELEAAANTDPLVES